jgi:tetratricopeptide (TPR) repeat protein
MSRGLAAENRLDLAGALKEYSAAHRLDPADPTPMRFLGELYRHHTGEWDKARAVFEQILAMRADPVARAVALHGLGKITIHEGQFKQGLALMEQSVAVFPLAIANRNLAVYWISEGDRAKGEQYTRAAYELDKGDAYNQVFAAVFLAGSGKRTEALAAADQHHELLAASYNLAAIYAQLGMRDKALAYLRRHFYEYERTDSVRAKEMMEARVDAVFDSLRRDPAFLELTSHADGRLMMR